MRPRDAGPPVVVFPSPLAGRGARYRSLLRLGLAIVTLGSASMVVDALGRPAAQWTARRAASPVPTADSTTTVPRQFSPARPTDVADELPPPTRAPVAGAAPARRRAMTAGATAARATRVVAADSGWLIVSSKPWGTLSVDGREIGPTPQAHLPLPTGTHRVVVRRSGYADLVAEVTIMRGVEHRLTRLTLRAQP